MNLPGVFGSGKFYIRIVLLYVRVAWPSYRYKSNYVTLKKKKYVLRTKFNHTKKKASHYWPKKNILYVRLATDGVLMRVYPTMT